MAGGDARELVHTPLPEQITSGLGIVWTPDGRDLIYGRGTFEGRYFEDGEWGTIELWRVAADGGEPRKIGVTVKRMSQLSIHPDGRRLAFSAGRNNDEVWMMENFLPALEESR